MKNFVLAAVNKSRTSISIFLLLSLWGIYAMVSMPKATEPDVTFPAVGVSVVYEGVSPQDSERLLAKPLETALRTIEGVEEVRSQATTGFAFLQILFDQDWDMDKALYDVRVKVDEVRPELPADAREPNVLEFSTKDEPILNISLVSSTASERTLRKLAEDLQDDIETLPEVLEANLQGVPEELLEAIVQKSNLESYGISISDLYQAISNSNRVIPAGSQDTGKGRFSVSVPSVFSSLEDINNLPIKVSGNSVITLDDIAEIRRTFKDRGGYSRINGMPAVSIEIKKRSGTNVIDTNKKIKALVAKEQLNFPPGIDVVYSYDNAEWALDMISETEGNVLTAIVIVMVVVLAVLGFRTSMLVGMAIPFCYLFALMIMHILGKEFNFMVMFGMLISMGMTIDGSIVVTEYADRKLAEGMERVEAYTTAASRMFWPVLTSTATTLVAFTPLMFWGGMGAFIRDMPTTVFFVLTGSLLYALVFAPILGALFGGLAKGRGSTEQTNRIRRLETDEPTSLPGFTGFYARRISNFLKHPFQIIFLIVFSIYILIFQIWPDHGKGIVYFPDVAPQYSEINISARGNLSVDEILELSLDVEKDVLGLEDVETFYLRTGSGRSRFGSSRGNPDQISTIFAGFYNKDERPSGKDGYQILNELRNLTKNHSGILVTVEAERHGPPIGRAIDINILGNNPKTLREATEKVTRFIEEEVEGLIDVENTLPKRGLEWKLVIDKTRAAQFGASTNDVGAAVQMVTNGIKVGEYRPLDADEEIDIRVRFPKSERNIDQLERLNIRTNKGMVSVSSFVESKPVPETTVIKRMDGKRVYSVTAEKGQGVIVSEKIRQIKEWLAVTDLGPGITIKYGGFEKYNTEAFTYLVNAFILTLFLMMIMMVTQFNSFYQSIVILSAIALSFGGVFLSLLVFNRPISTMQTGIAFIALTGIVVNNNIVLVDTFNVLKKNNPESSTKELALRTAVLRLRPVFLTSFTTIAGLLPIALGYSVDLIDRTIKAGSFISSYWEQMAGALAVGLAVGTVLTLVVTPCALALPDASKDIGSKVKRFLLRIERSIFPKKSIQS